MGADPNAGEILPVAPRTEARPEPRSTPGEPLLNLAVRQGNIEITKLLLWKGAKINAPGEAGFTPLIEAVRSHRTAIVALLLNNGAKPNQANDYGDTAIGFAANDGEEELVKALLKKGANIEGGTGWTPLMEAAYNGQEGVVKLLLKRGADVNLRRKNLMSPLMSPLECALIQNNDEIAALLKKAGVKGRTLKQLQAEVEQARKQFAAEQKAEAMRYSKERTLAAEDRLVIESALLNLLTVPAEHLSFGNRNGADILLLGETAEGPGLTMDDQMNSELDAAQAGAVTVEMRQHLQHRNSFPISLAGFKPSSVHILVSKKSESDLGYDFAKAYPTARAYIAVYLPGYSPNHDKAALRFGMGPSPHGAAGTCFLVREGGVWHIKWMHFAHFA